MYYTHVFMKIFILISILIGTTSCRINNESLFVKWNVATISSLNRQIQSSEDVTVKSKYENRLAAFSSYIDIKTPTSVNKNSTRYKFLKLIKNNFENKDLLILEATTEGEKIVINNYVLTLNKPNQSILDIYYYDSKKWVKTDTKKMKIVDVDSSLANHFCKLYTGFNQNDVIITHFKNGVIESSEFFLYTTLKGSDFKAILESTPRFR